MNKWSVQDQWRHGAQWQHHSFGLWADPEELCQIQMEGEWESKSYIPQFLSDSWCPYDDVRVCFSGSLMRRWWSVTCGGSSWPTLTLHLRPRPHSSRCWTSRLLARPPASWTPMGTPRAVTWPCRHRLMSAGGVAHSKPATASRCTH